MVNGTQGKEVGNMRVIKVTSIDGQNGNDFHLVALEESKHASVMLTNCSTTIRNGDTNERRVGSDLVEIKCGECKKNYYGRHVVDDNNNNR